MMTIHMWNYELFSLSFIIIIIKHSLDFINIYILSVYKSFNSRHTHLSNILFKKRWTHDRISLNGLMKKQDQ